MAVDDNFEHGKIMNQNWTATNALGPILSSQQFYTRQIPSNSVELPWFTLAQERGESDPAGRPMMVVRTFSSGWFHDWRTDPVVWAWLSFYLPQNNLGVIPLKSKELYWCERKLRLKLLHIP